MREHKKKKKDDVLASLFIVKSHPPGYTLGLHLSFRFLSALIFPLPFYILHLRNYPVHCLLDPDFFRK